ncbi:MAG TPA: chitobiase/beta-hexosaminidase C-terminal domain-containing protein, partial [Flavobacteriales bacterium]
MQRSWLFLLLLTGWRSAPEAQAQVVINEVCPKNATVLAEAPDHFPDWIELHNPGPIAVDLTGLRLSIDPEDPSGWSLPSGTLAPGGFLLLFEGDDNSDGHHFDFKLAREGAHLVLRNADLLPLSTLTVPYLRADHSFGLATATGSAYFPTPTPGAPNSTEGYAGYTTAPQFGRSPGFHAQGLAVNILSGPGTSVRFTTDGSEPGLDAQPYTGPVGIGGNTTLKAKAFQEGYIPSTTTVGTYFVGENSALPVVSLSVHPDSLFHPVLGLYMPGPGASPDYPYHGANFWTERGIAVHFEYFDEHGARRVQQELELRIHGGSASRTKPQRPFRLTARDVYGDDRIRHAFFPDRPEHEVFKRIILRNAGGDWCLAHYRDAFFHQVALHEGLDLDGLGFRSVLVFINGEYRGIHEIRERIDEDHLALTQGADPDSVLIMEEENGSIQGDTMHFHNL